MKKSFIVYFVLLINVPQFLQKANAQATINTTTTTTTHTVTSHGNVNIVNSGAVIVDVAPMNQADFIVALNSIEEKDFEDTKKVYAKQIIDANYLASAQVKQLLDVLNFEETKLEIAKYAYSKTVDQNKYYIVNDAFEFEKSIEELNKYIAKREKL